jgi:peptidoglycan/LPS O-acetylase OafA/YrhL
MSATQTSQHRFLFLDGLRGVAALCVGIFHAALVFRFGYLPRHAVLAVDFFFCLSGFVIAFAYDDKFRRGLGPGQFMVSRLVRLYPMIFVSVLLGGMMLVGQMGTPGVPPATAALLTFASLLLFPLGLAFGLQAFPPNDPVWSLFFELAANAAYGILGRWLSRTVAAIGLLVCAVLLIRAVHSAGGIAEIGFSNRRLFMFGFIRVAFPFLAGMLLYRSGIRRTLPALLSGLGVVAVLLYMMLGNVPDVRPELYDLACVLFLIPALVYVGARVRVGTAMGACCTWGGALSYPFYLLHGPILYLVNAIVKRLHLTHPWLVALLALAVSGVVSQIVLLVYDEPLRAWLSQRRRQSAPQVPARVVGE